VTSASVDELHPTKSSVKTVVSLLGFRLSSISSADLLIRGILIGFAGHFSRLKSWLTPTTIGIARAFSLQRLLFFLGHDQSQFVAG
jgi:hypothetical protein